ncbi:MULTISPECIES: hypothetical protein [Streptomyces]|uniref:Lipoprotein n=2 Tax=Streptomyces TaxID=1883 RepID=A0A3R7HM61_9ACTN|nr:MULTISPECIES: hypothetical protein [Streptomyces]KNE84077.1 hypothetical protein ADZ36_02025 [Streptomyces fradiae]OFA59557.1 hypothetical protein BEN35_02090 [Streptomyces fradiae]PQM24763.1 hypothetical protein Sfr7A_00725 [Streptomyces xinghaiensis]RKM98817.1 hypothetical protein SFRA_000725 [Streptomyces xinghaiensis]RNC76282.1 hypothetical protein DC095_003650 [Streptomyces xinghaiensis]
MSPARTTDTATRPAPRRRAPRRAATAGAAAAVLLSLTACAQPGAPDGAAPAPGSSRPSAVADGQLLALTVSGGVAGHTSRVTVEADGTVETVRRSGTSRSGRMRDEQVSALRDLLASERYARLPGRTFNRPTTDAFVYEFEAQGRTVVADSTSLRRPLNEVLQLLGSWRP